MKINTHPLMIAQKSCIAWGALWIVAIVYLTACANLERNSFRTIGTIVVTVDTAMNGWGDYVRAGRATAQQETQVRHWYERYRVAMLTAEKAVTAYQTSKDGTALQKAVSAVSSAAADLTALIYQFVPPKKGP